MSLAVRLFLAAFAAYRLSELFSIDDGPFYVFRRLRRWFGQMAAGESVTSIRYSLAQLFECPFCIGVWFAAILTIPVMLPTVYTDAILIWLAIAGFQTMLETFAKRAK